MSFIEHGNNDGPPVVRAVVPLFAPPAFPPPAPTVDAHEVLAPVYDITDRLAPAPELPAPAPEFHLATPLHLASLHLASTEAREQPALTRRQLREQLGGPLTTGSADGAGHGRRAAGHGDSVTRVRD